MKPLTAEWVVKAKEDLRLSRALLDELKVPSFDGAASHAQQAAEKFLKALLQDGGEPVPNTNPIRNSCIRFGCHT